MRKVSLLLVAWAACWLLLAMPVRRRRERPPQRRLPLRLRSTNLWNGKALQSENFPDGKTRRLRSAEGQLGRNAFERNLWIVDVATRGIACPESAKKSSTNAAWSPDGKWIVFFPTGPGKSRTPPEGKKQLYVISADGERRSNSRKPENDVNAFDGRRIPSALPFRCDDPGTQGAKGPQRKIRCVFRGSRRLINGASLDHRSSGQLGGTPRRKHNG